MYLSKLARLTVDRDAPSWRGPAIALGVTALAALARMALDPVLGTEVPFTTFYVSTMVATLAGGAWSGALAALAGLLAGWSLFLPSAAGFSLPPSASIALLVFLATQALIVFLTAVLRKALHRAVRAERALQGKIAELEALMDLAPVGIWFAHAPDVRQVTRNRFAAEMLRAPPGSTAALAPAVPGLPRLAHVELRRDGQPLPPQALPLQRALRGEASRNEEYEARFADGSSIVLLSNAQPIRDARGAILGAVCASLDVTALKRTEAALREAVAARELLQREADHRIKNSLQLVAGVLRLQRNRVRDEAAAALLDEAAARVTAVAEAHAALQRSPDLTRADMGAMVEALCGSVGRLNPDVAIACTCRGDTTLDVERAIQLGLVVMELLTNAVRNAGPHGSQGGVQVEVAETADRQGLEIEVRDQGTGTEEGDGRQGGLGRDLVRTLSARIGAAIETLPGPGVGTRVRLRLVRRGASGPAPSATPAVLPA